MFKISNLKKCYGKDIWAVKGIDLVIPGGICFGMLGPNGAGKSTTIEMMEGVKSITSGSILYKDGPLDDNYKKRIGIQFQNTALHDYMTVDETLDMFMGLYDNTLSKDVVIEWCQLQDYLKQDTRRISGGQKQRLLIAVALLNDPEVLFLDEPTTGLDPQSRRKFWELIRSIQKMNKTIILTTHYMEEAYVLCDEIVIIDKGTIIAQGPPQSLLQKHYKGAHISLPASTSIEELKHLNWVKSADRMEFHSENVTTALKQLMELSINLEGIEVKSPTLDDLFLDLTGKDLRE